jgi:hypothetical protein
MPQRVVAAERFLELERNKVKDEVIRRIFDWVVFLANSVVFGTFVPFKKVRLETNLERC